MPTPLNLLIVEDSTNDADLMLAQLRRDGFDPKWKRVETEPDFLAQLDEHLDLVLSDYSMPHFNGLRAAELLKQSGLNISFILVSGTVGEEVAVEAMKHGATDYLLKDRIARLGMAVRNALEEKRLRGERGNAEKALAQLHRRYELILNSVAEGIHGIDCEGNIVFENVAAAKMLGREVGSMVGKKGHALIHHSHADCSLYPMEQCPIHATLQDGVSRRVDTEVFWRADGTSFPVEYVTAPKLDEQGAVIGAVIVFRDITEQRQTAEALKQSERRFRELLENVELIAMTLDIEGKVTFCNDFLLRVTGWKREEISGADWFENFIPETNTALEKMFRGTVELGKIPPHHENPIKTRHGELRDIVWNNTMLRAAAGKFIGTASIGEDVTERRQAERALRESEEKFRQLAENINEVFWMTTPAKNQMLYVSPAYEKIWGRSCESLRAAPRTWLDAIHPEDRERIRQAAEKKQESGDYDEEYRIIRPDNAERWIHDRAFPIRDAAGKVVRIVGTAEDITARKTLEDQLRQAQKMEAIGQLAGGIAHDFNNILAAMFGFGYLLQQDTQGNPFAQDCVEQILQAAKRAKDLVQQILTFSRQREQRREIIRLNTVVKEAAKFLRASLPAQIEIESNLADAPAVLADATQIYQVTMNLATNALHAMEGRAGKLTINLDSVLPDEILLQTHPALRPILYTRLTVGDTGHGMDSKILQRIFEPFFTTKPVGKGTGLGLAVVHGIVQSHDGVVTVESRVGEGTTFCVYFPAQTQAAAAADAPAADVPRGNGEKILVVDDELPLTTMLAQMLHRLNYEVATTNYPQEAIRFFRENPAPFDLVVTDLTMPEISGLDVARQIHNFCPDVPVILASGYSSSMTELVRREAGITELVEKPMNLPAIAGAVARALGKCENSRTPS